MIATMLSLCLSQIPPQAPPVVDDTKELLHAPALFAAATPQPPKAEVPKLDLQKEVTYDDVLARAIKEQKPLVCFVLTAAKKVDGAIVWHTNNYRLFGLGVEGGVVIGIPKGNWMERLDMHWDASVWEIAEEIRRKAVSQEAAPFGGRWYQLLAGLYDPELADADPPAASSWPDGVPFPKGLVTYEPTSWTQAIFTLNGAPAIERVHRSRLSPSRDVQSAWQAGIPGGMDGISDFRSTLYRHVPTERTFQVRLPVVNQFGFTQYELGWSRAYPNGTLFVDVLDNTTTGKVFEARAREKAGGQWFSYVFFRRRDHQPAGYRGLKQTCVSCHELAGTGGYAVGLIPGGDTVISDPFPALER